MILIVPSSPQGPMPQGLPRVIFRHLYFSATAAKANGFVEVAVLLVEDKQTEVVFTNALALEKQGREININDDAVYIGVGVPTHKRNSL
jgi:hypothetical protein